MVYFNSCLRGLIAKVVSLIADVSEISLLFESNSAVYSVDFVFQPTNDVICFLHMVLLIN